MKQEEIVQLSAEDLRDRLDESREKLGKMILTHKVSPLENPLQIRSVRKTVARLETEMNKRNRQA